MSTITVLETNVLHASDILYWLDGSSAEDPADMQRLAHPIQFELNSKPSDLQFRHAAGKTALWRRPTNDIVEGEANNAEKTFVASSSFSLAGTVYDAKGLFNPRAFSITAGALSAPIAGQALILYPSPIGIRFSKAGGLIATLRFANNGAIVPWALLTTVVTIPGGGTQTYRSQADHRGDVMIPLHRLPPLPEGVTQYAAQLSVEALSSADPSTPLDTADLISMNLESLTTASSFSNPIGFNVVPGEIQLIRSATKDHLAVQSS